MRRAHQAPDDPGRKGRDAVDDHHGRVDQGGFDRGRAAGDDGHVGGGEEIVGGVFNDRHRGLQRAHVRFHLRLGQVRGLPR